MYFVNVNIQSKPLEFRQFGDMESIKSEAQQIINWFCDIINGQLVDFDMYESDIMSVNGLISVYEIKYKIKDNITNDICNYKTFLPKFIGSYIVINGQRYSFIYSIADRYLSKFGADRTDIKISNLYRKVVLKHALDNNRNKPVLYESKHKTLPLLNFLILYKLRSEERLGNVSAESILDLIVELLSKNDYKISVENIEIKEQTNDEFNIVVKTKTRRKKRTGIIQVSVTPDTITYVDPLTKRKLTVDVSLESKYRTKLALSFKDYGGKSIIERLLGRHSYETVNLLYGEFYAIFDPFVRQAHGNPESFLMNRIFQNWFVDEVDNYSAYNSLNGKVIKLKTFYLHPLIRQLMHLLYERIRTKRLPRKHNTTLSVLYKTMQIEYVEDKLHNPITEVMALLKTTFAHKYAIKRLSYTIRLVTDMTGIVDLIVTPESKKIGSVNYLVFQYDGEIQ